MYLVNLGCIDHNPWMSRVGSLEHPDWVLLDIDPVEVSYDKIVEAAQLIRDILGELGLKGYPKTTGGDGMHIYIPVEPIYSYEQFEDFAEILTRIWQWIARRICLLRRDPLRSVRRTECISITSKSEPAKPSLRLM